MKASIENSADEGNEGLTGREEGEEVALMTKEEIWKRLEIKRFE